MNPKGLFNNDNERRGVAPIIATLLMVAIAVVGGILIFVFAQGFFSSSQVEGPTIESVSLLGYDTRDVSALTNHAGTTITGIGSSTTNDNKLTPGANVAFYLKNTGSQTLVISSLKLAGEVLTFDGTTTFTNSTVGNGEYSILNGNAVSGADSAIATSTLTPGQETTVVAKVIDSPLKTGRSYTAELTTGNGATFKFDFIAGIQKG
jgi:archaeal type IV pilus assembly protein PilA